MRQIFNAVKIYYENLKKIYIMLYLFYKIIVYTRSYA